MDSPLLEKSLPATLLEAIAEFGVSTPFHAIPAAALDIAKTQILDSVGTTLAGAKTPAARALLRVAQSEGGAGPCAALGTGMRTSATWAALCNGTLGHALDFDDTNLVMLGHSSVPLTAATFACAELTSQGGREVLHAFVLGYEVESALGRYLEPRHYVEGWHPTCTIGTIGTAVAAAKLLGLSAARARHAVGLAASHASGLRANFGTMTKPFHAGHAARSGVLSALLAREGFTSSPRALEGKNGFVQLFKSEPADPRSIFEGLGTRWEIVETPSAIKQYPSAAPTHSFMDALRELARQHRFTAADVASVTIAVSPLAREILPYPRPRSGLEGKFSIEYCAAVSLLDDPVGLGSFSDDRALRADAAAMMARVSVLVDEAMATGVDSRFRSRVQVTLVDGRTFERPPAAVKGDHVEPLARSTILAKFLDCAREVLPLEAAHALQKRLLSLEACERLAEVTTWAMPPAEHA